ncbi:hypothetical protein EHS13_09275 [Paenibacillus psychroresistens]|uniref:LysM domain-containing protein n=1 Tax=Paenibacillus psychroresistens TaxID=1778678 RepID=A0A6B8RG22_9BACL|nr:hypothetical protein [Paenibacillus psychroresistens]QGQ95059.1 hypothetical protein EHS13_09275 [Paenibacillus psychroresistens]
MNPKRIIIVGTMAIAITFSAGMFGNDANAQTLSISIDKSGNYNKETIPSADPTYTATTDEDITQILGLESDEALYEALYTGNSLADIADNNQIPIQDVIDLQVAELTQQLDSRLASGSITPVTYLLQKSELPDIVTKSIHVRMTP